MRKFILIFSFLSCVSTFAFGEQEQDTIEKVKSDTSWIFEGVQEELGKLSFSNAHEFCPNYYRIEMQAFLDRAYELDNDKLKTAVATAYFCTIDCSVSVFKSCSLADKTLKGTFDKSVEWLNAKKIATANKQEWLAATYEVKLATVAEALINLHYRDFLNPILAGQLSDINSIKLYSASLVEAVDSAFLTANADDARAKQSAFQQIVMLLHLSKAMK